MYAVKTFFVSTGFLIPRNLVSITETNLDKMIDAVEARAKPGYRPEGGFSL